MSQYLEALRQAMVIYPMIVVLFTVPYIAWSYHKYGSVLINQQYFVICHKQISPPIFIYIITQRKSDAYSVSKISEIIQGWLSVISRLGWYA